MMEARKTLSKVAAGLSALLFLFLLTSPENSESGLWLGWLGLAVVLELIAARLPAWGYASVAPGVYLAAVLHPRLSLSLVACAVIVGLGLRAMIRPRGEQWETFSETVSDLLPLLMWLSALEFFLSWSLGWLLAAVLYLLFHFGCARWLAPVEAAGQSAKLRSLPFVGGGLLLGGLTGPRPTDPLLTGIFVVTLLLLNYGSWLVVRVEESLENRRLQVRLFHQRRQREALETELSRLEEGGQAQKKAHQVLKTTLATLDQVSGTEAALQRLGALVKKTVKCDKMVAVVPTEEGPPRLVGDSTPLGAEAGSLCRRAWREHRPLSNRVAGSYHLALPVGGYAVLYLVRSKAFLSSELDRLWLMVRHGAVMFSRIAEKERSEKALAFVSEERRLLSRWVHRLNQLLEGSRHLLAAPGPDEVRLTARKVLESLIPHEHFLWVEVGQTPQDQAWAPELVADLVREAGGHEGPVFRSSSSGELASLMVMMLKTQPPLLIGVGDRLGQAFQKEERDLFCLLGSLTESSLHQLRLAGERREAAKLAAVGQIAAGLSHELNTPLAAVQLAIESAQQFLPEQPEKAEARLEGAREAFGKAGEILEGLLFFATSYAVHEPEELELEQLLRELTESLGGDFQALSRPRQFRGHRLDLEHMVRQLLRNAQQAHSRFGLRLSACGDQVTIQVWDEGSGVEPEIRERIFEPFFTGRETGEGLGLGLSVSRRIAELHGGGLRLLEGGTGAVFEVTLPTQAR